jgi:nucleoside-diphosphate-sugar epimerase
VQRVVLLTGSGGGVAAAVSAALAASGLAPRHVPLAADGRPRLAAQPGGAEAVVHLGLRTPRELDEPLRAEAEAAAAVAAGELARAVGARRFVHVSTVGVYGRPRNLPCREGELKRPRTAHERIRWRAEQASWEAFRRGTPLTVLRPTMLYGPGLRGGPVRVLPLVTLFNSGRRRVPIIRRGPVAHLCHVEDLAGAVAHVLLHPDDRAVAGRAFNVGDDAPLPLAEHLAAALAALGFEPGRVLPTPPRLTSALLWLFRHVPDRVLVDPLNRRLASRWDRFARRAGVDPALAPRVDREALHWMAADHYYDTARLAAIGWRPLHPLSTAAVASTIRSLVAQRLLPGTGAGALPAW